MNDLRVGKDLLQIIDRTGRDAGGFQFIQKLFAFHSRGQRTQFADQFGATLDPAFIVLIRLILGELGRAENAAQFDELGIVTGGNDDAPVGDRKFLIGDKVRMGIANALGKFAGHEIVERLECKRADCRIDQRGIHVTAASGLFAPQAEAARSGDPGSRAGMPGACRGADPSTTRRTEQWN